VSALEVQHADGHQQRLIVRQHEDYQQHPQLAAAEFQLLQRLHAAGLPVPRPYHLEPSGDIVSVPALVLAYIDGAPEFAPPDLSDYIRQFTTTLVAVHQVEGAKWSFLPDRADEIAARLRDRPAKLAAELDEARLRDTLESVWPLRSLNPPVLLHGDYWPGNLLWRERQLVGVIDWEDAARGDPLSDLANSRLEILWAFGTEAMQMFTQQYGALRPALDLSHLPYWDLCAGLRPIGQISGWGLDPATEQRMHADLQWFIAQALKHIPGA
jgi:aminoglycoside phosphotransferase (APT) family kinase protein